MLRKFAFCGTLAVTVAVPFTSGDRIRAEEKQGETLSGWQRLFRAHAAGYTFTREREKQSDIQLLPDPILNWRQPVRGGAEGAVFLWVQEGRPLAIGTMFIYPVEDGNQGVVHELHSLSEKPFVAAWRERTWTPPANAIAWKPLARASEPAANAEQRLRQMRELARQFSAQSIDHEDQTWDLRLLPRTLYRFDVDGKDAKPPAEREVLDGALFGFVEGTDLEVVMLVQARKTTAGHEWQYAIARMSDFRLKVKHADEIVWEVNRSKPDDSRAAYNCSRVEIRQSAE